MRIIEAEVIQYLIDKGLADGAVYAERPDKPEKTYILVQKTGSGRVNHINQAMVAIQSITTGRLINAAKLNEAVKEAMEQMPDEADVFKVQLNSDYNYTNTTTKEHRYQAVFNIYY